MSESPAATELPIFKKWLRGLRAKLILFLIIASVPALFVVELGLLSFEYWEATSALEKGAAKREAERIAKVLSPVLLQYRAYPDNSDSEHHLRQQLEIERLHLQDPSVKWLINEAYVLHELSAGPLRLSIRKPDGSLWIAASTGKSNSQLIGARVWQAQVPIDQENDHPEAYQLRLEVALAPPWRKIIRVLSFEWPVIFALLLLLGTAVSVFIQRVVLKRLDAIAIAAEGWSQERFSKPLIDHSADEIGVLTARLNMVATALSQRMAERSQLAALEERQRLARDLHDSVKQHGFALELQLGAIAAGIHRLQQDITMPSGTLIALQEAQTLSKQLRVELDVVLAQLRVPSVANLTTAIQQRGVEFARRSGIAVDVRGQIDARINDQHLDTVLKIFDEAMANVWRHAQATQVIVELSQEPERAGLRVIDNGQGFDRTIRSSGMGRSNMELRAATLPGCIFQLDSTPNQGTRVELSWIV
jgi:signal transduction histidine kinase